MTDTTPQPFTTEQHIDRLNRGWVWLERHPNRRDWDQRFEMFLGWLRDYEQCIKTEQEAASRVKQEALL